MNTSALHRALRCAAAVATLAAGTAVAAVLTAAPAQASTIGSTISRNEVLQRAQYWVDQGYTYTQTGTHYAGPDGDQTYRRDCSGLVSMAWHLNTGSSGGYDTDQFHTWSGTTVLASLNDLKPGDALLKTGHIELFAKWKNNGDHSQGAYVYSFNSSGETVQNPYVVSNFRNLGFDSWSDMTNYTPRRLKNIRDDDSSGHLGDVNGDGKLDVVARDGAGNLWLYPGLGSIGFGSRVLIGTGFDIYDTLAVADANDDGYGDLVLRNATNANLVYYQNSRVAGAYFSNGTVIGTDWDSMLEIHTGDPNNDGRIDVIARNGSGEVWLYPTTSNPFHFGAPVRIGTGFGGWDSISFGDINSDGFDDLVGRVSATGNLYVFYHTQGATPYGSSTLIGTGFNQFDVITVGDFDLNGTTDLVVRNQQSDDLILYRNSGTSSPFSSGQVTGTGWGSMSLVN